ncbi:hypothetical protein [Burkholderia pseudomallei]|uniref:hypothetical protein n=1 Tax=Burkholderia pseudomallei TaxID=28450 RepID=UPI0005365AAF|nr:hypothetical protein [Burkholderia pseudomallei]KGX18827.1 hypothetical protein X896_728 [Burkholderia pseudomallei ABCPW 1]
MMIDSPAQAAQAPHVQRKHSHYHKACPYPSIDVYRVLELFKVTDPCIQHAVKKLLVAGGRGQKDIAKDIQESIDTLSRWQEMRAEEGRG